MLDITSSDKDISSIEEEKYVLTVFVSEGRTAVTNAESMENEAILLTLSDVNKRGGLTLKAVVPVNSIVSCIKTEKCEEDIAMSVNEGET